MSQRDPSRRLFLKSSAVMAAGAGVAACSAGEVEPEPAGITTDRIEAAEALFDVRYTPAEREQLVDEIEGWITRNASLRAADLDNALAPACTFDPRLPGRTYAPQSGRVRGRGRDAGILPVADEDIAFAPVWKLSDWIRTGQLSSRRLTEIYLTRMEAYAPQLECFVSVPARMARAEAEALDAELAAGNWRGPLHGIPYGMKDIIDVAGVRASWGAAPYRDRIAEIDATVTQRLRDAGAVMIGKTTNGAIAYGDIWFGGMTRNPFNPEEGSSGSSAGSAAATAAALVGFSIGTETLGSIVSPSNRCGTTGLRPTFGRVSRHGAMALCWSLDKIGPICRSVEDTAWVLDAINGYDPADAGSLDMGFDADAARSVVGLRVGYNPAWFERGTDADRAALEAARAAGVELVEISIPERPYDALFATVEAEAAAAFENLTVTDRDDELVWQDPEAWPNTWRRARFISAVDLLNIDRFRRQVMVEMGALFSDLDAIIGPNFADSLLTITNYTGHPQLAFRSGFNNRPSRIDGADESVLHRVPQTTSVWAPLFREDTLIALGCALEEALGVGEDRPENFT